MSSHALLSVCKIMKIFFAMNELPQHDWRKMFMISIKITTPDSKELDKKGYHIMEFPDVMVEEEMGDIRRMLKQKYNINNHDLTCILTSIKAVLITEENLTKREMKNFNAIYKRIKNETKKEM